MQKSVKRFLSLLLVCMLTLSALPVHGLAAHAEEVEEVPASEMPTETPAEPVEEPAEDPVEETPAAEDPAEEIPAEDPVEESTVEVPAEPAEEMDAEIPAETVYTITFQDWDGAVLATVPAAEGETPVYPNEAPQRAADETYVYMFAGWDVDGDNVITEADVIPAATEDATYVAVYDCSENPEAVMSTALSDSNIGFAVEVEGDRETDNALPDGDTIVITASGIADYGIVEIANKTTVTLTNNYPTAMNLSFDFKWEMDNGGIVEIDGVVTAPGTSVSVPLDPGDFLEIVVTGGDGTTKVTISNLKLSAQKTDVETTFAVPVNGSYTVDGNAITAAYVGSKSATESYAVAATAAEGYVFFGWYNETTQKTISYEAVTTLTITDNATVCPVFVEANKAIFGVGTDKFHDLQKAGEFAKTNGISQIILLNSGTLTGEHTIPAGVTLLIPYDELNTAYGAKASCNSSANNNVPWVTPTPYRTLTMAANARITVKGNLEVSGQHSAAAGGGNPASPTGPLGYIKMETGSNITMESGSNLFAWGYIYGAGEVTANNGSRIYEIFQITDFRGGELTAALAQEFLVFPLSQYYVQNVEVKTTYRYGAEAYVQTSIFASNNPHSTSQYGDEEHGAAIKFIGAGGLFQPTVEGSFVTKKYNSTTDNLELNTCGDCALAPLTVTLDKYLVDSSKFVLPITNNIQITIHSGTVTLKQNMMLLPGSNLTIKKDAVLKLDTDIKNDCPMVEMGGYVLQVLDSDNWTTGIDTESFETVTGMGYVHNSKQFIPAPYTAAARKTRTNTDLTDVTIDVNGRIIADGFLYSTVSYDNFLGKLTNGEAGEYKIIGGGANIISSEKTGVIAMNNGAGKDPMTALFDHNKGNYYAIPIASAQLKNGDGSMLDTTDAAPGTGYVYDAEQDCWVEVAPADVTVTWKNGDTVIYVEEQIKTMTIPKYRNDEKNPEKAYDNTYHYIFAGWSTTENGEAFASLPPVIGNTTFYAVYTAEAHTYENGTCECGAKEPVTALLGDIDLDGDVDAYDLTALARHVGGIEVLTKAQALANADVDGNGEIDAYDLTKHARYVGGIITDWKQN